MTQHIRLADEKDIPGINRIYNEAVAAGRTAHTIPLSVKETAGWLKMHPRNKYPVFVFEEGIVKGWISFTPYREGRQALKHTSEISFYVADGHQGKGIGKKLVSYAKENAANYGFRILIAFILETNVPSIRLMEACGFSRWGFMPGVAEFADHVCGHILMGVSPEPLEITGNVT